jgi:hypothetical protein
MRGTSIVQLQTNPAALVSLVGSNQDTSNNERTFSNKTYIHGLLKTNMS